MGIICEKDTHPRRKQIQLDPVRILRRGNGGTTTARNEKEETADRLVLSTAVLRGVQAFA